MSTGATIKQTQVGHLVEKQYVLYPCHQPIVLSSQALSSAYIPFVVPSGVRQRQRLQVEAMIFIPSPSGLVITVCPIHSFTMQVLPVDAVWWWESCVSGFSFAAPGPL